METFILVSNVHNDEYPHKGDDNEILVFSTIEFARRALQHKVSEFFLDHEIENESLDPSLTEYEYEDGGCTYSWYIEKQIPDEYIKSIESAPREVKLIPNTLFDINEFRKYVINLCKERRDREYILVTAELKKCEFKCITTEECFTLTEESICFKVKKSGKISTKDIDPQANDKYYLRTDYYDQCYLCDNTQHIINTNKWPPRFFIKSISF